MKFGRYLSEASFTGVIFFAFCLSVHRPKLADVVIVANCHFYATSSLVSAPVMVGIFNSIKLLELLNLIDICKFTENFQCSLVVGFCCIFLHVKSSKIFELS